MVEITNTLRRLLTLAVALLPIAGWICAQPPVEARIAGLENDEEYMSLLREEAQLQLREDSVEHAVEGLRRRLRETPAGERQRFAQEILQLESRIFELRNAKGRLIDRINAIEQEWVLANLDETVEKPRTGTPRQPAAAIPDSLKVRDLIRNSYFRDNLSAEDYAALQQAQELESQAAEYANRYFAGYATLAELAASYAAAATESEALEIHERFDGARKENEGTAAALAETGNYIFDNKSYAYSYLLDKLGRDDLLAREEERMADVRQQLATLRGETASDEVAEYFLRKRASVEYEQTMAGVLGLDAARDSLDAVARRLAETDFRQPKITIAERLFLDYDSVAFSKTPKYSYKNPIPECRVYARGTIYRILLGTFNTKRAADLFRGAYPLFYLINDEGKWCYYAGGFATREEADAAQALLKKRGFLRPEIVVWTDGEARNLSREPEAEAVAYRVEITGSESLSEAVKQAIAQHAEGSELSRVGQTFVIGTFDDRALADRLAAAIAQADAELQIKVAETAE